jgi:hypothetical protein
MSPSLCLLLTVSCGRIGAILMTLFYTSKLILYVNDQRVIEKQVQVRGVVNRVASMAILQTFIRATTRKILVTFCVILHYMAVARPSGICARYARKQQ